MKTTQIKFYPNLDRKSSKSNQVPIYMRITKNGKKAESKLNFSLKEEELKLWNSQFQRMTLKNSVVNRHLDSIKSKFDNLLGVDYERIILFNALQIRDEILGSQTTKQNKSLTLKEFIWTYLQEEIHSSKKYSIGTYKNYKKAIKHMDRFVDSKFPSITFLNVDFVFANSFKNYLLKDDPNSKRKGMSEVSAAGIIIKFKKIIGHAILQGLLTVNPFNGIKLSYISKPKENFPLSEIKKLFDESKLNEAEIKQSLIFQFMILTGCAFQDCQDLTEKNIVKNKNGDILLTYRRNKTDNISSQYLTSKAIEILREMKKYTGIEIIPSTTNQHLNRSLKIIGLKQGISNSLNSHIARSVFRQLINEIGVNDALTVDQLMGWSSKSKIDSRYRTVSNNDLVITRNKLQNYLGNLLAN
jgi:integrase/recombinase XerD